MLPEQITVTVDTPPGLSKARVTVAFEPETVEEFDAIVEATGGAHKYRVYGGDMAFGTLAGGVAVHLHMPRMVQPAPVPEPPSFMREFAKRGDEARDFIQTLESDAAGRAA